ncbi:hypothetical protein [Paraburkholderia sp. RL17-337-BIB-A]|uniref:hypothetical protein n=1 Tax=Paraburkholderia sp. RL17-337-BIB-A TaxID=3031636 RepID=UPI0038BE00B3
MKSIKNWFQQGASARFGYSAGGFVLCIWTALAFVAAACVHRMAGYYFPHHVFFRNWEADVSTALPSTLEHVLCAFGLVAFLTILMAGRGATVRLRVLGTMFLVVGYFVSTTLAWDYKQFLSTHDGAQLAQMGGDALGLVVALVVTCWPGRTAALIQQSA